MCKKLFVVLLLLGVILPTTARAATAIRQHDPCNTNLIGYWMLDDANGKTSAYDSSKYHVHTAIVFDPNGVYEPNDQFDFTNNTGKFNGSGLWKTPKAKSGQEANCQNARLRLKDPGKGTHPMQPQQGTVALWAKLGADSPRSITANRFMWGFRGTTNQPNYNRIQLFCNGKGSEVSVGLGGDNQLDKFIKKLNTDQWYHFALTWNRTGTNVSGISDDGEYTLYIDGVDQASGMMTTGLAPGHYRNMSTLLPNTGDIGNSGANGSEIREGWYGEIDEVGLYDNVQSREVICYLAGADPNKAWNPIPDDNEGDPNLVALVVAGHSYVPIDASLTWSKGTNATSHDIYLGTDLGRVTSATTNTTTWPEYKGNKAGTSGTALSYTPTGGLQPSKVYRWRIDEQLSGTGTPNPAVGNVWKFRSAGATAGFSPDTNSVDINADVTLSWSAASSVTSHDVYFGTARNRVLSATANTTTWPEYKGNKGKTTVTYLPFDPPSNAKFSTLYYWRIDEKNETGTFTGPVWNFTTADYFTIDNFESYIDSTAMQVKWSETGGGLNGRTLERDELYPSIIGSPAMIRLNYNNTTQTYSYTRRPYTAAWDYTFGGLVKTMSLWYKCDPNTKAIKMKLQDSNSPTPRVAVATLSDPNTNKDWHEWIIILDDINNTSPKMVLSQTKKVEVGDGNEVHPAGGSNENVYFDELRLYKQRFLKAQTGDVDANGVVNYIDVKALKTQWLYEPNNLAGNPDFAGGVDGNGTPNGWRDWYKIGGTEFPRDDAGVPFDINVPNGEGNPKKPAGRVLLDEVQTQGSCYGDLVKSINISAYENQTLNISFKYKGDLTVVSPTTMGSLNAVNAWFEYRVWQDDSEVLPTQGEGGPYPMREGQLDTGYRAWDWKSYSHTQAINDYQGDWLHLSFTLSGRGDPCTGQHPRFIIIDHLIVKTPTSTLPTADISEDTYVTFGDFVIIAANWLDSVPLCPPDCTQ